MRSVSKSSTSKQLSTREKLRLQALAIADQVKKEHPLANPQAKTKPLLASGLDFDCTAEQLGRIISDAHRDSINPAVYLSVCALGAKMGREHRAKQQKRRRDQARLKDEARWITVHPHGKGAINERGEDIKGQPVLIESETGQILGGMGGKHNGKTIKQVKQETKERNRQKFVQTSLEKAKAASRKISKPVPGAKITAVPSSRTAQHNELTQRIKANPLPPSFNDALEGIDHINKLWPNTDCHTLYYMDKEQIHAVAKAVHTMAEHFPLLAQGVSRVENSQAGELMASSLRQEKDIARDIRTINAQVRNDTKLINEVEKTCQDKCDKSLAKIQAASNLIRPELRRLGLSAKVQNDIVRDFYGAGFRLTNDIEQRIRDEVRRLDLKKAIQDKQNQLLEQKHPYTVFKPVNDSKNAYGWCYLVSGQVNISNHFLGPDSFLNGSFDRSFRRDCFSGFHPPLGKDINPITPLLVHEFTHALDAMICNNRGFLGFNDPQIKALFAKERREHKGRQTYALDSIEEYVAERVTEALTSPSPSPNAMFVLNRAKEHYNNYMKNGGA